MYCHAKSGNFASFSAKFGRSVVNRSIKTALLVLGGVVSLASQTAQAQSDAWWFDVEVILFKRIVDGSQLNESFPYTVQSIDLSRAEDLFSAKLSPKARGLEQLLPRCYHALSDNIQLPAQTAPGFEIKEALFHDLPPDPAPTLEESYTLLNTSAEAYNEFEQIANEQAQQESSSAADAEEPSLEHLQMAFSLPEDDSVTHSNNSNTATLDDGVNNAIHRGEDTEQTLTAIVSELNDDGEILASNGAAEDSDVFTSATSSEGSDVPTSEYHEQLSSVEDNSALLAKSALSQAPEPIVQAIYSPVLLTPDNTQHEFIDWQVPQSIACHFDNEVAVNVPFPDEVPNPMLGLERNDIKGSYLLPRSELKLRKLARDLHRKRGIDGLTHFAWRQKVEFGKRKAKNYRIFAGKNYTESFTYEGYPIAPEAEQNIASNAPELASYFGPKPLYQIMENLEAKIEAENRALLSKNSSLNTQNSQQSMRTLSSTEAVAQPDIVTQIEQQLAALELADAQGLTAEQSPLPTLEVPLLPETVKPEQVWELDGRFKLYLQNIGRVPYLHIDSHLNYRQPMILEGITLPEAYSFEVFADDGTLQPQQFLKPYPFKQLRRVISQQIHYFDHPMFGMVVQIRRYRLPSFMR